MKLRHCLRKCFVTYAEVRKLLISNLVISQLTKVFIRKNMLALDECTGISKTHSTYLSPNAVIYSAVETTMVLSWNTWLWRWKGIVFGMPSTSLGLIVRNVLRYLIWQLKEQTPSPFAWRLPVPRRILPVSI